MGMRCRDQRWEAALQTTERTGHSLPTPGSRLSSPGRPVTCGHLPSLLRSPYDTGEASKAGDPPGRESHLLRVTKMVSSGEQGQAASCKRCGAGGGQSGGVRPEWGAQAAAGLGLPGAQSHGHREQEHPNWLSSLLPALSAEAPVKGWSCPGCPRLSLLRGPAWPPTRGSAADTTCLGWHGFSLRPELRSSRRFGLPSAGLVPSSGIFPPHLWLVGGAATET